MAHLAIAVVAIGLPDSLNPSLILAALYLAAGSHPGRRTAAFTAAAFAVTLAGGVLIAFGVRDLVLALLPKPSADVKYAAIAAVGIGLALGGVAIWLRRERLSTRETSRAERAKGSGGSAALMGAGIAGVELLTAFPYFAAIALVVGSSASLGNKLALLVLYNVVYVLPLIGIVGVCVVMGNRADQLLGRVRAWGLRRWPLVVAPVAFAVGVGLALYGVARLV